jgi:hypothetical protein
MKSLVAVSVRGVSKVVTTLEEYGHLFPGTDGRLDSLLEDTYAEVLRTS